MNFLQSNHSPSNQLEDILYAFPDWFLDFDEEAKIISLELYQLLAKGKPVSKQVLAEKTEKPLGEIEKMLNSWSGIYFNDEDEIIGYWGLTIVQMPHQFIINDITLYTWCAWDALFIPTLIGETALIESQCPISNQLIKLTVTPDGVQTVIPSSAIVTFIEPPESEKIQDNVVDSFCHYVHFLNSSNEIKAWESEQQGKFIYLTIDESFLLGKMKNEAQYKSKPEE